MSHTNNSTNFLSIRIGPVGSAICMYNANNTGQSSSRPGLFDVYRGDFAGSGVVNNFVEV